MANVRIPAVGVALLLAACQTQPAPAQPPSTLEPVSVAEVTPTSASATPTTSAVPLTTITASPEPTPGPAPQIELLPPAPNVVSLSEIDQYYSFAQAVGTDSYTLGFQSSSGENGSTITVRIDGERQHLTFEEGGYSSELIFDGESQWARDQGEEWLPSDELPEFAFIAAFLASPDQPYAITYGIFGGLDFAGWVDTDDGARVAVYQGDSRLAAAAYASFGEDDVTRGSVEVAWDPEGFFRWVRLEQASGESVQWSISDVGTTTVEPPS